MNSSDPVLCVDFGGTIIKAGLVRGPSVLAEGSIPARSAQGLAPQLSRVRNLLEELCDRTSIHMSDCVGIGVALPTPVDAEKARVTAGPTDKYTDVVGLDLRAWAQRELGLPLAMENDAHAALLGEWQYGAGRGQQNMVVITLGTGIGTSVLMHGKPLRGAHFQAGVLGGHLIVNPGGRPCGCGGRGCYEAESGSRTLPQRAMEENDYPDSSLSGVKSIDYATLFAHAEADDALAIRLRDRTLDLWGSLVVSLIHCFDPEVVILGGGIVHGAAQMVLPWIQDFVAAHAWTPWGRVRVVESQLGDTAALLGMSVPLIRKLEYL